LETLAEPAIERLEVFTVPMDDPCEALRGGRGVRVRGAPGAPDCLRGTPLAVYRARVFREEDYEHAMAT
jgi:hypothetical protein